MNTRNRIGRSARRIPEEMPARLWSRQDGRAEIRSEGGEIVRVVCPGRRSARGPDYRDAVVYLGTQRLTGDVEIHVRSSDWQAHGHDLDAAYNSTILHVALEHDSDRPIITQAGCPVPQVLVAPPAGARYTSPRGSRLPCCRAGRRTPAALPGMLLRAGWERFLSRAAAIESALPAGPQQVLFRAIARGLGYSANADPMDRLAGQLPLAFLDGLDLKRYDLPLAWLLGTAGLLPSQRGMPVPHDGEATMLERLWGESRAGPAMSAGDWSFSGARATNSPVRRLAGLSHLLRRHRREGLLPGMLGWAVGATSPTNAGRLEAALVTRGDGYWWRHRDFGLPLGQGAALIGKERAGVLVINALLPFTLAWGRASGEPALAARALEAYGRYGALAENDLTRYMSGLLSYAAPSAAAQQGLIHIFRKWCRQKLCHSCPLARATSSTNS